MKNNALELRPERYLPVNRVFVSRKQFDRLQGIAARYNEGIISEWEMAHLCMSVNPFLEMFHLNDLVVV